MAAISGPSRCQLAGPLGCFPPPGRRRPVRGQVVNRPLVNPLDGPGDRIRSGDALDTTLQMGLTREAAVGGFPLSSAGVRQISDSECLNFLPRPLRWYCPAPCAADLVLPADSWWPGQNPGPGRQVCGAGKLGISPSDSPRHVHLREGPHRRHRRLHRRLERTLPPVHLDQNTRRNPDQG